MDKTINKPIEAFNFMGLRFNNLTLPEAIARLQDFISQKTPHMMFTPNAELIVRAKTDADLRGIYERCSLLTVDSFVVYYAVRLCGWPLKEPVSAAKLMLELLPVADKENYKVFLLGAKEEIVQEVKNRLNKKYPGIKVVGIRNGYFDFNNDKDVVAMIRNSGADVLFVAMSSPLKEQFVSKNLQAMNVSVCLGVGGSFDIIAGKCKLAPEWMSRIGLEWFYRFIQEPGRLWKRYLVTNTKFSWMLIKEFVKTWAGKIKR